jgi:hypothetical protein
MVEEFLLGKQEDKDIRLRMNEFSTILIFGKGSINYADYLKNQFKGNSIVEKSLLDDDIGE